MPRNDSKKGKKGPKVDANEDFQFSDSPEPCPEPAPTFSKPAVQRKRKVAEVEPDDCEVDGREPDNGVNFSAEMQDMLKGFGADISKTLASKKKRLEQFSHATIKASNKKVDDTWVSQHGERNQMREEFMKQTNQILQQFEADLEKSKEQEEKLLNMIKQQQKLFQQCHVVHAHRLKSLRQLHEQYAKSVESLDQVHTEQNSGLQSELRKEMGMLQKKILMDTQQQEMANVRKSLHSMLF